MEKTTERSAVLEHVHGAIEASGIDQSVAAHYGSPLQEQRALVQGRAIVDLSHHKVFTVEGADRLSWLSTLSSQVLTGLTPGDSAETLFLSVQGRVEYAPHVLDDGARTWLIVESAEGEPLRQWLEQMRFALRVEVTDRSKDVAVVGTCAIPDALHCASRQLAEKINNNGNDPQALVWTDSWPGVTPGGWAYAVVDPHPGQDYCWHQVLIGRDQLVDLIAPGDGSVAAAGVWAAEALRIAAWRPRWGTEVDNRTLAHELDWLRTAVHLDKGCYKGQEAVARVHNLGHPPRRLVFLDIDGSEHTVPPVGAEVVLGERVVGAVTSAQLHHEAGPIALAVIKRSVDPHAEFLVRSPQGHYQWAAAQTMIVPPDAGQVVQRPQGLLPPPR